jgi:hypothetical protein
MFKNRVKIEKIYANFCLSPKVIYGFKCTGFDETHNYPTESVEMFIH